MELLQKKPKEIPQDKQVPTTLKQQVMGQYV